MKPTLKLYFLGGGLALVIAGFYLLSQTLNTVDISIVGSLGVLILSGILFLLGSALIFLGVFK